MLLKGGNIVLGVLARIGRFIACFWMAAVLHISLPASAVEVTDQAGRRVSAPDTPTRVVALAPSITEIIFAVGRGDRLVGVTQLSDYPPPAARIPRIGTYIHLDLEKIAALAPDLCIGVKDGNPIEIIRRLDEMKIPVYAVDPKNLASVGRTIREIGGLLNAEKESVALAADMERRIERVKTAASKADVAPGVFFQIGISPIVAAGSHTIINELIETAGGKNLTAGPTAYPRLSREQVIALAPDVLIVTSMTQGESYDTVRMEWEAWKDLPAVRDNRLHVVNSDLYDRPSPRIVDGLEQLFSLLHPEAEKDGN